MRDAECSKPVANSAQPPNRLNRKERRERKGKPMKDLQPLCAQVRQTAYDIHLYHGHGHLEKVYENALAHRLRKAGLDVKQQYPIKVFDEDGTLIGNYYAELLVDGWLIVELKLPKLWPASMRLKLLVT